MSAENLRNGLSSRGAESTTVIDGGDPLIGQTLSGNYVVEAQLGAGGMGAVYRGRHVRLPKAVAIKLIKSDFTDPTALARFRQEAEVASQVGSEHIVTVFDFNTLPDGTPYLVMELLEGEDLEARLAKRGGTLSVPETRQILEQLVRGLSAAHAKGVVHRDLKPANIFLCAAKGQRDLVKILDFGLSKIVGAKRGLTSTQIAIGTPDYMSPEQCYGDAALDQRSDVYSLGAVLYELLTGSPPFIGSAAEVLTQIVSQPPPSMRVKAPQLPPPLDAAVLRALEKDPADRPQNVEELWEDVTRAIEASTLREAWRSAEPDSDATVIDSKKAIDVRQGPRLTVGVAVGLGLVLAALGFWMAVR